MIWLKILGVVLMIAIYVGGLVGIIIFSASRRQLSSVLIRIITNYFQIVLMIRNLKIQWPEKVEKMLDAISIM